MVASAGDAFTVVHTITNIGNTCLRDITLSDLNIIELECSAEFTGERYETH